MNPISVSAYSVREHLGPISVDFTDVEGNAQTFSQDFPKVIDIVDVPARVAGAYPVTGVEAVAFHFAGPDDPALASFAERAGDAGLALVNMAVDVGDLLQPDDARRTADVIELERWIDALAALGFRFVRVNPGSPFTTHHGGRPPAHLVQALTSLGQYANERGIRLLVENHGGPSSDPEWMTALLDAVGPENLGLLLDLGNFDALMQPLMAAMFAERGTEVADPLEDLDLTSLYDGVEALAARAELVHVKAHRVEATGVGPVDLPRALGILARAGYDGWLTIEYEGSGVDPWAATARVIGETASTIAVGR
ncbi:TIM barrel protein [Microbacterium sp. ET2]|uniref:sugar phosphate isomerase/epimerase family protein n=1 Tax=Microbacterium albipurpureum TaxID=3050384 RepID=UPI00259C6EC9|nr:TIM barrel protein [Microbacterium sp. ET2 (Ac-2212)]WJL96940.1 TIM barrel protein [Microbacterium sp. ET2 (Ac-2212)]